MKYDAITVIRVDVPNTNLKKNLCICKGQIVNKKDFKEKSLQLDTVFLLNLST